MSIFLNHLVAALSILGTTFGLIVGILMPETGVNVISEYWDWALVGMMALFTIKLVGDTVA